VLVSAGLAAFPAAAQAEGGCSRWGGQISGVTADGPGLVTVKGLVLARTLTGAYCAADATVLGYATLEDARASQLSRNTGVTWLSTTSRTGATPVNVQLALRAETGLVCLGNEIGSVLDCFKVTVSVDATSGAATVPLVYGRISLVTGKVDDGVGACGLCV
jgi:hypothetical protein